MKHEISPVDALIDVLRSINPPVDHPVVMYEVGIPMIVERRFTQDETLNALTWLQSEGLIKLMGGNRLRLLRALPLKASEGG
ncbi:hypothetical protein [Pararhizobium qamdonense]|uniref:hypothetical protein n=1 Tax=Pararhizobium qamdonense TaxID=3031126 RepID=UPI0023E328A8|nr:hypothetical protein [Pararhizobium qamdonense]